MRALLASLLAAAAAAAAELAVVEAWSRATVPGQEAGAVFARIVGGDADDRLLAAESPAAATVEVHEHAAGPDGVMRMRAVAAGIPVPAGSGIELRPRSWHIMLIGLKAPLAKGQELPVAFVFERRGRIEARAAVLDPWAMAYDDR